MIRNTRDSKGMHLLTFLKKGGRCLKVEIKELYIRNKINSLSEEEWIQENSSSPKKTKKSEVGHVVSSPS